MSSVISFHTLHDASVSVCVDGELKAVLELERYFDVRYFVSNPRRSQFIEQWKGAIRLIIQYAGVSHFDIGVTSWVMPSQRAIFETLVNADKWVTVDHHLAHAGLGFYDSPFEKALVLSYDGGGNDGTFNVYLGDRISGVKHQKWVALNLGTPYRQLATCMLEVTREQPDPDDLTTYMRFAPLALSGKVMGYSALGSVRPEWVEPMKLYYTQFVTPLTTIFTLGERLGVNLEPGALSETEARDVAATSQHVFSELLLEQVEQCCPLAAGWCDGIVLTGGCALNVHANQLVVEKFGLPVHVPCAPNDCGIAVGASWIIDPPKHRQAIQYCGLPCFDSACLKQLLGRGEEEVTPQAVAELLLGGAIIGVVRGRQEFGPRALGHRSMLCYPDKVELKEKLNKLKSREWFRPLCPSVAVESVPLLFEGRGETEDIAGCHPSRVGAHVRAACIDSAGGETGRLVSGGGGAGCWVPASPYMSFAPRLRPEARQRFPAICHFDGTARLQTVRREDDEWYHAVLTEVAARNGGYGILLNTSFNVKGKPILNRLKTALHILDTSPEGTFDFVIIENWLFRPRRVPKQ